MRKPNMVVFEADLSFFPSLFSFCRLFLGLLAGYGCFLLRDRAQRITYCGFLLLDAFCRLLFLRLHQTCGCGLSCSVYVHVHGNMQNKREPPTVSNGSLHGTTTGTPSERFLSIVQVEVCCFRTIVLSRFDCAFMSLFRAVEHCQPCGLKPPRGTHTYKRVEFADL